MKIFLPCCAAITLYLCVLPLAAQEDGSTNSINPQEQLALDNTTLAVLPLEVLSTDPRAPSVAAAINEAIRSQLSSIAGLHVVASDSVLPFADSPLAPEEIARVLGVGSVLEGSLQIRDRHWGVDVHQIGVQDGKGFWVYWQLPRVARDGGLYAVGDVDFDARLQELASGVAGFVEKKFFPERTPEQLKRFDGLMAKENIVFVIPPPNTGSLENPSEYSGQWIDRNGAKDCDGYLPRFGD